MATNRYRPLPQTSLIFQSQTAFCEFKLRDLRARHLTKLRSQLSRVLRSLRLVANFRLVGRHSFVSRLSTLCVLKFTIPLDFVRQSDICEWTAKRRSRGIMQLQHSAFGWSWSCCTTDCTLSDWDRIYKRKLWWLTCGIDSMPEYDFGQVWDEMRGKTNGQDFTK